MLLSPPTEPRTTGTSLACQGEAARGRTGGKPALAMQNRPGASPAAELRWVANPTTTTLQLPPVPVGSLPWSRVPGLLTLRKHVAATP